MYILAIETTGPSGSVALLDEKGKNIGQKSCQEQMSHLKNLMPMIKEIFEETEVSKTALTHIAPSIGPGSFTGIRIGVSTARALGQVLQLKKGIPVPTLDAFLYKEEALTAMSEGKVVCAIINARRGQVYGIVGGSEQGAEADYMAAGSYMLADVLEFIKERIFSQGKKVLFFGDGIDAYEEKIKEALGAENLGESYFFAPESARYQDAASVGKWAYAHIMDPNLANSYEKPYSEILPEYMRRAEAEEKLAAGELPICKGPKQE